jgi:hypothetical protein
MKHTKASKAAAFKTLQREIAELGEISASINSAYERGDYAAFAGDAAAFIAKHKRVLLAWDAV